MDRPSLNTDLLTLIGMAATISGILLCLFILLAPATFGAVDTDVMIDRSPDLNIAMRWIQPILGQAIVEDVLSRQRLSASADLTAVEGGFTREASGSVQWMLGRVIVELNRSRIVSGLAGHQDDDHRILSIARHAAEQFETAITANGRRSARLPHGVDLVL